MADHGSWNERFQAILEKPALTTEQAEERRRDIDHLAEEYIHPISFSSA